MGWWYLVYWIATIILSEVMRPKVNVTDAAAVSAEDADMPTVSSVKPIPVIWGKVRLRDPNLVWYGDYFASPIKKRAGKGGFLGMGHTIWQTVGYRYHWGQQLALCHGPITLHKIWMEEREVWSGTSTGGSIVIDSENLYGGEDSGGGIVAQCVFYPGSQTQDMDPYLTRKLTSVPAYRGTAVLVWYGPSESVTGTVVGGDLVGTPKTSGYIGTSPIPRAISFELSRYPSVLVPAKSKIGDDANPAEMIYECLTTDPNGADGWGMGLSATLVDVAAFTAAANKLYDEGFGLAMEWNSQSPVEDVIAEICKVIDAVCYRDFRTGLYTIKLIRGGYDIDKLPILDEHNILELENYSQAGIDGTTNDVTVNYTDRSQNYKKLSARAQDLANMRTQGDVVTASFSYLSVMTASLADRLANRELFAGSNPLAKIDAIVNREAYAYGPGDLFVVKWADLGVGSIVMRVQKAAVGLQKSNRIRLTLVQDVFNLGVASLSIPGGSSWVDPIENPAPITKQAVIELPYFYNTDQAKASYMVCAQRPNSGCTTFETWEKLAAESSYTYRDTCLGFTPMGVLASAYQSKMSVDNVGFTLVASSDLAGIGGAAEADIRQGANLAVFESGEFIAFTTVTRNTDGTITVSGVWGGMFDTVPSSHAAGERIWFYSYGAVNPEDKVGQTDAINVKNLPTGPRGSITLTQATAASATMASRNMKPIPPAYIAVNSILNPTKVIGAADVTWKHRVRSQTILRQDDPGPANAEGVYDVKIYVGGSLVRMLRTTDTGIKGGTPGIHALTGLVMRDAGTFIVTTYRNRGALWNDQQIPARVFTVTSAGLNEWCGSITETGLLDGIGKAARFNGCHHIVKDSTGNYYVLDNGCYIRKITPDGIVSTWLSLNTYADIYTNPQTGAAYGADGITSLTIDGSDNLYFFTNHTRQIFKVTPSKVITVVAGNPNESSGVRNDGTGLTASFSPDCVISSDATGNIFVQEYWGQSASGAGTLRYCTAAGVVTTIRQNSGEKFYPSEMQLAVIGSDAYFAGYFDWNSNPHRGVRKATPAGVIYEFVTLPAHGITTILNVAVDPSGFLAFVGVTTNNDLAFGKIDSNGVITITATDPGSAGYSCAQRIQDNSNGSLPVEIRVSQTKATQSANFTSLENSSGQFQMTGFGMSFGQTFGGMQL